MRINATYSEPLMHYLTTFQNRECTVRKGRIDLFSLYLRSIPLVVSPVLGVNVSWLRNKK